MKFCTNCNNMLYPKENQERKQLMYKCEFCDHEEPADDPCVSRTIIKHTAEERTTIITDLAYDPTLPRSTEHECPRCHQSNVIYFQASSSDDSGMELFFVCQVPDCGNRWKSNTTKEG